jgi:predicted CxxxxCH...CXXCH cytochrome family protein
VLRAVVIVLLVGCAQEREPCTDCEVQGVHRADYDHAKDVAARGYDLPTCQGCHGEDFAGNGPAPSCLSCHEKGPTACDTCHENPPTTAAHPAHLAQGLACMECHVTPTTWDGHASGRPVSGPAKVTQPSWNGERCTNVYCHGTAQPRWTGGATEAACGSCHGVPPPSHARNECAECHTPAKHVDGKLDVGLTCTSCHASPPPTGAHAAHNKGGFFSLPMACSECHKVPTTVTDVGHIDSAAPAELTFGSIATARGANPTWNGQSCSDVSCHGPLQPSWSGTAEESAYCGGCHGLPPTTPAHNSGMTTFDCVSCHAQSVTQFGGILVGGGKHVNGVIDGN